MILIAFNRQNGTARHMLRRLCRWLIGEPECPDCDLMTCEAISVGCRCAWAANRARREAREASNTGESA
jgi:hypothetical protein